MENFTPFSALTGGLFIGLAALILLLANGRISGISGITSGLLIPSVKDKTWRALFLLGLVFGCILAVFFGTNKPVSPSGSPELIAIAGLLVGIGTAVGNGCTSGHGVCGISRLSMRSLVATMTFMFTGALTVFLVG